MARAALALLLAASAASPAGAPVLVRASEAAAPCAGAAARAWGGPSRASVEAGDLRDAGDADVLVGSGVEITRAVESGRAVDSTETAVAKIPWVLSVAGGNPLKLGSLQDLGPKGVEVVVLGGPAAYEARRALAAHPPRSVHESTDARALRDAAVALVPLSLAGGGERIGVDVPAIVVRAAVTSGAPHPDAARAFVQFLGSGAGQKAFASCTPGE